MNKSRVAVIGLGNMGQHHVRNYFELPEANLVAVCDANQARADEFAQKYNCKAYTSVDDLLGNEIVDAISITSPTSTHFDIAKKAITQNVNVLVEKPICDNITDAEELIALAEQKGLVLMVGHIERFNPAVQKLKSMIDANELGKVTSLISRRVGAFPPQIHDANVVIDLAVHDIDIFNYLLNKQPSSVTGNAGRALINGREDYAELFLKYGDQNGFIQVNWITPIRIRQLAVTGTNGYAELDFIKQEVTYYQSDYKEVPGITGENSIKFNETKKVSVLFDKKEPLKEELKHFLNCVTTKSQPLVHGSIGMDALKIALDSMKDMNMTYVLAK